jgi:ubiquinone/menaquinone biosynthesis C-methylase UbiE
MKTDKAYNLWANQYDTNINKTRDLDQKVTMATLTKYKFNSVLELGCGTGKNTEWFLKKADKIIAFDFSEEMLHKAKAKITSKKVTFYNANLNEKWNVKNDSVNLISVNLVLEHIKNLDFIFNQAHQKLNKNGLFFICELHPFKQYLGSKARFETENGTETLEVYTHHITDYLNSATNNNFKLLELKEWFDHDNNKIPRLISFVFEK